MNESAPGAARPCTSLLVNGPHAGPKPLGTHLPVVRHAPIRLQGLCHIPAGRLSGRQPNVVSWTASQARSAACGDLQQKAAKRSRATIAERGARGSQQDRQRGRSEPRRAAQRLALVARGCLLLITKSLVRQLTRLRSTQLYLTPAMWGSDWWSWMASVRDGSVAAR